jgi:hypothetical protein
MDRNFSPQRAKWQRKGKDFSFGRMDRIFRMDGAPERIAIMI